MSNYIDDERQTSEHGFRPTVFLARDVRVGSTPVPRYVSWDEHRVEMRRTSDEARAHALARRAA